MDDSVLQRAVAAIPKDSIFLIEDIDCAFPSREDGDESSPNFMAPYPGMVVPGMMAGKTRKSNVTLSGLLNVLDGVGSEEGKLFFATVRCRNQAFHNFFYLAKNNFLFLKQTNFVDHLDPAILRPGRIDRKIQYKLATKQQAIALFCRFYPESHTTLKSKEDFSPSEKILEIQTLAEKFAEGVPEHEFSTAELQGYLLTCKKEPEQAVEGISEWVAQERKERADRETREAERKAKNLEARDKRDANQLQGSLARLGIVTPSSAVSQSFASIREPTATTTTSTPIPNPTALEDVAGAAAAPLPAAAVDNIDARRHKPKVNGTTDSRPVTPLRIFPNLS